MPLSMNESFACLDEMLVPRIFVGAKYDINVRYFLKLKPFLVYRIVIAKF